MEEVHDHDAEWLARANLLLQWVTPELMDREMLRDLVEDASLLTTRSNEISLTLWVLQYIYNIAELVGDPVFGHTNSTANSNHSPSAQAGLSQPITSAVEASRNTSRNTAGNYREVPDKRDRNWKFQCDVCGHKVRRWDEFHRHITMGTGRKGFTVMRAKPPNEMTWYGVDKNGSKYSGNIIVASPTESRYDSRMNIQNPCRDRIREFVQKRKAVKEQKDKAIQQMHGSGGGTGSTGG
ncbi:hypothetical protein A1O3_06090 [Capronia epimyces CBS 606.96]|uniref:Uncharacterized protein n=1 Tax=Capronia epimyces CBS 606.96 TaxID=1182542 RepID=W9XP03_9EURO|nr:uncharacterized protein A1O3_06090 [Capronia epimyces CBS 606.96]EXJ82277.1 hypothetical protein A1O3_06090 [Capronia epimyces CBS 606.96]